MKNSGIPLDRWSPKAQLLIAHALEKEAANRRLPRLPAGAVVSVDLASGPDETVKAMFELTSAGPKVKKIARKKNHERTDSSDHPSSSPEPERAIWDASLEQDEAPPLYSGRVSVRIVSYRKRLCDPDNLCVKATVDCLRYSGIIANDRPEDITLHVSQEKVKTSEEERTEILITPE